VYRIRTDVVARDQIAAALPNDALEPYAQILVVLELVPWHGHAYKADNPTGALRQLVFRPGGRGLVTYLILEDQRLVDVLEVLWLD
jgi:hypothetical protein